MRFYEQSTSRGVEILVGSILMVIALSFLALIGLVISNAIFGYSPVLGSLVLASCSFWFGKLGYRLVLNIPRKDGGLFSINGLKVGCIFFGVSSIFWGVLSIIHLEIGSIISALGMIFACLYGWKIAKDRASKKI
jgi:hypothetical protein